MLWNEVGSVFSVWGMNYDLTTYSDVEDLCEDVWMDVFTYFDGTDLTSDAARKANEAQNWAEHIWKKYHE